MDDTVDDNELLLESGMILLRLAMKQNSSIIFFFFPGTEERSHLFDQPSWQRLLLVFLAELIGTAFLMFFGCMGLVPNFQGGELSPYSGAIAFSGIVAVVIIVSIL